MTIAKAEGPSRTLEHEDVHIAIGGGSSLLKLGLEETFDFSNRVLHNKHLFNKSRAQLSNFGERKCRRNMRACARLERQPGHSSRVSSQSRARACHTLHLQK